MENSKQQLVSMGFLIAALSSFVAFHLLLGFGNEERGWHVWPDLWRVVQDPKSLDAKNAVIWASFLNFSLLIVVSPFLKNVWPKSLWAWWGAVIFSGLAGAAFWVMYFVTDFISGASPPGVGGWCLMTAPIFNFVGLLLARGGSPEHDPVSSGSPESAG